MTSIAWLASDLHLSARRPAAVRTFLELTERARGNALSLYLLGDVFDAWVGDDDVDTELHAGIVSSLRGYTDAGGRLYVLRGNRDFLLGDGFALTTGARLLDDPVLVDLCGTPTVLMHGDLLCTDDVRYQAFRKQVRDPAWQAAFLARPLADRHAMAVALSRENEAEKSQKTETIMDVTDAAVVDVLRKFGYARLIHGHTHRPGRHIHEVDGHACERWVLADWYDSASYLECSSDGCVVRLLDGRW